MKSRLGGYIASFLGVALVALLIWPFYPGIRVLTAANSLLIVVLLLAVNWGMGPAIVASILGGLYINYFFIPPLMKFDFHIDGTEDVVGLIAFLSAAILVGELSSRAEKRARENKFLYDQLREAFARASELEGIKQSERLKSALLDTVTHDLRTPLTSIKGAALAFQAVRNHSSLSAIPPGASEEDLLNIIVQQSDRMDHFIENMIELARVDVGAESKSENVDGTSVDEIILAGLARAEDLLRGHDVTVVCDDDLQAAGNSKAIAQVIFSLLENAARYSLPGTPIWILANYSGASNIQIAIEDEGPGVDPAYRDKIFDRFFRGDTSQGNNNSKIGLGLGLAIARGIVETSGGKIWVEDRENGKRGSRFVFTVPAKVKADSLEVDVVVPR